MTAGASDDQWQSTARELIRHTVMSYAVAGDTGNLEELAAQFTVDGVLEIRAPQGVETGNGRAGIIDLLGQHMTRGGPKPPGFFLRHNVSTQVVQSITENEATGVAYFTVLGPSGPDHWGRYRDRYVLDGNRWRFAHRVARVDAYAESSWFEGAFLSE